MQEDLAGAPAAGGGGRIGALMQSRWRFAALAGLGALAAAGQAPLDFWWLTLPALAGIAWVITGARCWRGAAFAGWCAGTGYFAAALFWIVDPFLVEPQIYGWMAPFALLFMAGGMALFWALAGGLAPALGGGGRAGRAFGFAVALAATGLLRTYVFTGFPWALVGHVWVGTWVAQSDALAGPVALSLLTALVAVAPVALGRFRGGAMSLLLLGAAAGYGGWRLHLPEPPAHDTVVRLVQPNAAQRLKWRREYAPMFFERMLKQTAKPGHPDLIVWPETSVWFLLNRPGDGLKMIARAARGAEVALGIQRLQDSHFFNSLAFVRPDASVAQVYDKHHLVPFGEYIPFGSWVYDLTGFEGFDAQLGYGYTPGPGAEVLDLGKMGQMLPLICYEAIFPQDLRVPVRPGWILQITDDGWFGTISGPYQHLAQVRLRAIEQGLPILRAANTGVTAVIDARGRILQEIPLQTQGTIDTRIPGALPPTPYSRWGDWPAGALLLLIAAGLLARRRRGAVPGARD